MNEVVWGIPAMPDTFIDAELNYSFATEAQMSKSSGKVLRRSECKIAVTDLRVSVKVPSINGGRALSMRAVLERAEGSKDPFDLRDQWR